MARRKAEPEAVEAGGILYIVQCGRLRIRNSPSTIAEVTGSLVRGEAVVAKDAGIVSDGLRWAEVDGGGGYVAIGKDGAAAAYLKPL